MNVKTYDRAWTENEGESYREVVIETATERIVVKEYNGHLSTERAPSAMYCSRV